MINVFRKILTYRDWSIKFKLFTISVLLILCSVFFVSFLSYFQYTKDFTQQSIQRNQQIIEQLSFNIQAYLDDLFNLSLSPYYNTSVMQALEQPPSLNNMEQLEKIRLIETFLDNMLNTPRKDIISVYIIADKIYRGGRFQGSVDTSVNIRKYEWYRKCLSTQKPVFVPTHTEQLIKNPKYKVFSIAKQLSSLMDNSKILGVIKVDASYSAIESICNRVNTGKNGGLFIIDENNNIIYSKAKDQRFNSTLFSELSSEASATIYLDKEKYLINSITIKKSNWRILSVNSVSELNRNALQTRNRTILMALMCSAFAILILFIFIRSFLSPLLDIIKLMKEVKRGNLDVSFPEQRSDEVGYLGSSFNAMIHRINEMLLENTKLVQEVYETKLLQREAQINALYSQIRPHFIYNTLNMISLSMQCGKTEKAVNNINKLSSLMRGMANVNKEITLQSEVMLLDSYLGIQSNRYEGRLDYSIEIDQALYPYYIPALIFQPIVENSVVHGCEAKKDKTTIKITSAIEDDTMVFTVQDDGTGMNPEELANLQEKVYSLGSKESERVEDVIKRSGIGLINVNKRIKIKYGEKYGLEIDSQVDRGTSVRVILPRNLSGEAV